MASSAFVGSIFHPHLSILPWLIHHTLWMVLNEEWYPKQGRAVHQSRLEPNSLDTWSVISRRLYGVENIRSKNKCINFVVRPRKKMITQDKGQQTILSFQNQMRSDGFQVLWPWTTLWSSNSFSGYLSKENEIRIVNRYLHTTLLSVLFTKVKTWEQLKSPSVMNRWRKLHLHTHTHTWIVFSQKEKGNLSFARTWTNLDSIILKEIS